MEEVGAQVAAPVVIHQQLSGRFRDMHSMAKKRGPPFPSSSLFHQNPPSDNWNPKSWGWDCARFVANPLQREELQVGISTRAPPGLLRSNVVKSSSASKPDNNTRKDEENLPLSSALRPVSGPNKRVRSGSPGDGNNHHPMCQVDDCKEDLSAGKDYHRRHKVCEVHSKASKALVGKQMQRFCQRCSRFHPLSEFDEGKRSCRRRLAGHNRRRRKTQPEDTSPRVIVPDSPQSNTNCDVGVLNVLAVLARAQGKTEGISGELSSVPEKDRLVQILSKISSLPLPANLTKMPLPKTTSGNAPQLSVGSENQNRMSGNASSQSTMDLLAALSQPSSDAQSQPGTAGGERSDNRSYHSPMDEVGCRVQETSPNLQLQLFISSPEDINSARKLRLGRNNYLSSNSSNPSEERSPVSSAPLVHNLFPMQTSRETSKDHARLSNSEDEVAYVSNGCTTSLQLFGNGSIQSSPYRAGYTSSSESDRSPSSLNSDVQDRTGRIIFKLFDKDPSHLPGSLRMQLYNWLSSGPSEMESYIRPGCVVLSLYLSMPSFAWGQLEENLLNYVKSLVKDIDVGFWGAGRFFVYTDKKMASHKDGKIRIRKSWRAWNVPELISVSPIAVVAGQETSLLLRGRNLTARGTEIHCTHADGYNIRKVEVSLCQDTEHEELSLDSFKISGAASSNMLGRCFVEVENSFKGTIFPVIIADNTICHELRLLEPEIHGTVEVCDGIGRSSSRDEALHFLDKLGWLFQRKNNSSLFGVPDYRLMRFKFLLIFAVEHDFCAVAKTLLDILLELNLSRNGLGKESLTMLLEIHLLNRAVRRRCLSMVHLLTRYSVIDSFDGSEKFIFVPNLAGPGGFTPLHLAACASSSDDLVDALTSDPQEIGLRSWNSILDGNGLSPYAYASMRNNHSYNALVARKLADSENGQFSVSIGSQTSQIHDHVHNDGKKTTSYSNRGRESCPRCAAVVGYGHSKKSRGMLQRPYLHSMLVIAAVCVCVCVILRGHPYIGCFGPFAWENLGYGSS